jgi:K+ transporter
MKRPSLNRKALAAMWPWRKAVVASPHARRGSFAALTLGALGIVYGDIGTSPLYAMDQLFFSRAVRTPADVLSGVSLAIWTITLIVAVKYAILVLRAQNDGEGGVFALYGLLSEPKKRGTRLLLWLLMLGAGLLFGDGIITPAISVLSAVEGLQVATPALGNTVIPITIGLLTVLFAIQFKGTSGIGIVFGPVLVLWFIVIAALGAAQIAYHWGTIPTGLVWGALTAVNASFLVASSLKFVEGGFVPLSVGVAVLAVMTTWRWGRKATFAAYTAKPTMTMAELVALHRKCEVFMERNAVVMSPKPLRLPGDRTPALIQMLWERHGILSRNLIVVEVTHRKVPYIHDNRYRVTVFDRDRARGSIIGVELSFGFMEEPNVERYLEEMARHNEIDLPTDRHRWIVHASHENIVPVSRMGLFKRLRFRLFMFLRLVSQPAYYYYGLGDEVQLSVEIIPVRVH